MIRARCFGISGKNDESLRMDGIRCLELGDGFLGPIRMHG